MKIKYFRGKKSRKCLFGAYFSLISFPPRLGRTITLSWEVAMETDLYCSLFAIVFFSGTRYLTKILTAVKQTSNPRGLKNGICISSPHPHPPPFKGMTWQIGGSQILPTTIHFPRRQMLTRGAAAPTRRGLWLPVCGALGASSPTCTGPRCSVQLFTLITFKETWETQK